MAIRFINIAVSFVALLLLLPLLIIIGVVIKVSDNGPVIHWSKRVGRMNKIFLMPKYRTMQQNTPQLATHLLDGQSYLSPPGGFLRKTSLDELPQFWSVLVGDMSLVGPRPALFNQDDLVELRTRHNIHLLPPGITGWAQINGRDELSIEDKVAFDKYYYENRSLLFDIKILFLTFLKVVAGSGVKH